MPDARAGRIYVRIATTATARATLGHVSRLALLVAVLVTVCAVAVPSIAGGASQARVRIVTLSPLVVRGTGFKSRERIRVTATPGGIRRVVSTAGGAFRATFTVPVDRCMGLSVAAVGARGDRAALKLPQPACPPGD